MHVFIPDLKPRYIEEDNMIYEPTDSNIHLI